MVVHDDPGDGRQGACAPSPVGSPFFHELNPTWQTVRSMSTGRPPTAKDDRKRHTLMPVRRRPTRKPSSLGRVVRIDLNLDQPTSLLFKVLPPGRINSRADTYFASVLLHRSTYPSRVRKRQSDSFIVGFAPRDSLFVDFCFLIIRRFCHPSALEPVSSQAPIPGDERWSSVD